MKKFGWLLDRRKRQNDQGQFLKPELSEFFLTLQIKKLFYLDAI